MLEGVFCTSPFIKLVFAVSGGAFVLCESLFVVAAITSESPLISAAIVKALKP